MAEDSRGEFADLRPGQLSGDMRAALGIGPLDPPPWLQRMRELGYPPGWRCAAHGLPMIFLGCVVCGEKSVCLLCVAMWTRRPVAAAHALTHYRSARAARCLCCPISMLGCMRLRIGQLTRRPDCSACARWFITWLWCARPQLPVMARGKLDLQWVLAPMSACECC